MYNNYTTKKLRILNILRIQDKLQNHITKYTLIGADVHLAREFLRLSKTMSINLLQYKELYKMSLYEKFVMVDNWSNSNFLGAHFVWADERMVCPSVHFYLLMFDILSSYLAMKQTQEVDL